MGELQVNSREACQVAADGHLVYRFARRELEDMLEELARDE